MPISYAQRDGLSVSGGPVGGATETFLYHGKEYRGARIKEFGADQVIITSLDGNEVLAPHDLPRRLKGEYDAWLAARVKKPNQPGASTAAARGAGNAVGKALGKIPSDKMESLPAAELYKMLQAAPTARFAVATGEIAANENVTYRERWFYDRQDKVLVMLERQVVRFLDDRVTWRIWYDVSPEDFRERLPYGRDNIRTKGSPFRDAKSAFPLVYPDYPAVIDWP